MSGWDDLISGEEMTRLRGLIAQDSISSFSSLWDGFPVTVIGGPELSMECSRQYQVRISGVLSFGETPSSTLSSASTQDLALAHRAEILEQRQRQMRFG